MTRKIFKQELDEMRSRYLRNRRGWIYLIGYSAKLVMLIADNKCLNCDSKELEFLIYDLFQFQNNSTHIMLTNSGDDGSMAIHFKTAIVTLNTIKKRIFKFCVE